jgi:hypothetical protein
LLYLVGIERPKLLVCIKEPIAKASPQKIDRAELVEAAI